MLQSSSMPERYNACCVRVGSASCDAGPHTNCETINIGPLVATLTESDIHLRVNTHEVTPPRQWLASVYPSERDCDNVPIWREPRSYLTENFVLIKLNMTCFGF